MIEIRKIGAAHEADIRLKNEPFSLFGRLLPAYRDGQWSYTEERFAPEDIRQMCFPDEAYALYAEPERIFLGAYDADTCVGLAVLDSGFFQYMYLYDLKVSHAYRQQHIGQALMAQAKKVAVEQGYSGLYTICQDNNLGACLFYLHSGFSIGGLDTNVYRHTPQEGKRDILLYCESPAAL